MIKMIPFRCNVMLAVVLVLLLRDLTIASVPTTKPAGLPTLEFEARGQVEAIAVSSERIAIASNGGQITVKSLRGEQSYQLSTSLSRPRRLRFVAEGAILFCESVNDLAPQKVAIDVWRVDDGRQLAPRIRGKATDKSDESGLSFGSADISPNGEMLVVAGGNVNGVQIISLLTGRAIGRNVLVEVAPISHVSFLEAGERLIATFNRAEEKEMNIAVISLKAFTIAEIIKIPAGYVFGTTRKGDLLAMKSETGDIIDLRTEKATGHIPRAVGEFSRVFGPLADQLTVADKVITVWEFNGQSKMCLSSSRVDIESVAISSDGSVIAGAGDKQVVVWLLPKRRD
jgi:hypothetical protein